MEITTVYIAQVWGPVLLAVGLGFFVSRKYYERIYRDLEKAPFAVLFFGMFAMAAGIVHILAHNAWDTFPQIVVSLIGWGLLLKGLVCTIAPGMADRSGDWVLSAKLVPTAGIGALVLGAYLSYIGYFV